MPMLLPEKEKEKELQFRSISTLMLTQVELKTFHVEITTSPNCILLFIYPQFITLNTRTAAVKKKKLNYWNVITHLRTGVNINVCPELLEPQYKFRH